MESRALLLLPPLLLPLLAAAGCGATPNPERPGGLASEGHLAQPTNPPPRSGGAPAQSPAAEAPAAAEALPATATPERVELIVGTVGGEPIGVTALVLRWLTQNPLEVREVLGQVVVSYLVASEAQRLGIRLDPELVESSYLEIVGELEEKIRRSSPGLSVEDWIASRLGLSPEFYLDQARSDVVRGLLAERVVRAFGMGHERASLRAVVTREREVAERALARAQAGEDFAAIARELSLDPSSEHGGRIPPIPRGGSPLSRLAFQTGAGGLGGPIQEQGSWVVVSVEGIHPAVTGRWEKVGEAVEASLAELPVQDLEFLQWKSVMEERYEVDLGPLLDLASGRAP